MSIELIQAAQQALLALENSQPHPSNPVIGLTNQDFTNHEETIRQLRTAIQQAEAQQPATGEPVVSRNPFASRCYTMSESHLSGHRLIVGFEKLGDVQDAHEWVARQARGDFTHPAPSVPGDDFDLICNAIDKADTITMEGDYMLDSDDCIAVVRVMQVLLSVRAAMLAAK